MKKIRVKYILAISILFICIIVTYINNKDYHLIHDIKKVYKNDNTIDKDEITKLSRKINKVNVREDEKYLLMGVVEVNKNNIDLAKDYFYKAIDSIDLKTCNVAKTYIYKSLAQIMLEEGNMKKGVEYTKIALDSIDYKNNRSNNILIGELAKNVVGIKEGRKISIDYLDELVENHTLDKETKSMFLRMLSAIHIIDSDYTNAILLNLEIIKLNKNSINSYYLNKSIIDMSFIARELGGYDTALEMLNSVDSRDINDRVAKADIEIYKHISLGQIKNISKMSEEALKSAKAITEYEDYIPEPEKSAVKCLKYIIIAEAYTNDNEIELAKNYIDLASKTLDEASKTYLDSVSYYYIVLGKINIKENDYEKAKVNFYNSLDALKGIENKEYEQICLMYFINIFAKLEDVENIEKHSSELSNILKERNSSVIKNYYQYIGYKEEYESLQESKKITRNIVKLLIIVLIILVVIVIKSIIYPYMIIKREKLKVMSYIKNNNYILNYQPIVDPINNEIVAFESLIRLKLNDKIIYPDVIIKQIEKSNMMVEVSICILDKVIKEYSKISKVKGLKKDFYLSMNVSLKEIEDTEVCDKFIERLRVSGLRQNSICIEITENKSGKDYILIRENLKKLMDAGFMVAIDDFGVDYSNISFLEKLEFNIIKLDKYFIDNLDKSIVVKSIVDSINYISINKNIKIVVEGLEEKEQLESIKAMDSNRVYIQGYYYAKPMDIDNLSKFGIKGS